MIRNSLRRALEQFRRDLREDPYLAYILLLGALVMLFFVWHRLPNFATRDERWRVVDFYEVVAFYLQNSTFEGIKHGVNYGRSYGATMFLYGLVELPIVGYAALTHQLDVFETVPSFKYSSLWAQWQTVPAWLWTSSVLAARLVNAVMAIACIYLVYRIGTILRDRWTGRLAAVLTAFTWGLIMLAHEAGEDVPALFAMVLTVYFAVAYLDSGERRHFLLGTIAGGLAISLKPTAGVAGIMLGAAHLLWMRREAIAREAVTTRDIQGLGTIPIPTLRQLIALARPGMLAYGLVIAATTLFVTYPRVVIEAYLPVYGLVAVIVGIAVLSQYRPLLSRALDGDLLSNGGTDGIELGTDRSHDRLARPVVVVFGLLTIAGVLLVLTNLPTLEHSLTALSKRLARGGHNKNQLTHGWLVRPTWWWVLRGFLNGLGWPLFLAGVAAVVAAIPRLRERSVETDGVIVSLVGIGVVLYVYSSWSYVRTHHLLLLFPLIAVLVAIALARLRVDRPRVARVLTAALVVTTVLYGGIGALGYANAPADQAVHYLDSNAGPNATVEVYTIHDPQEAAVPHDMTVIRPSWGEFTDTYSRCPDYIELTYQHALMFLAPDNQSYWSKKYHSSQFYADHFRTLLTNDSDAYEVAGTYGPKPFFLRGGTGRWNFHGKPVDQTWNLVRAGIFPRTIQYGDPQDFGVYEYMIILKRTGTCGG